MNFKKTSFIFIGGLLTAVLSIILLVSLDGLVLVPKFKINELKTIEKNYGKIDDLKNEILENYYLEVDSADLYEGMIYGMFESVGDKYTSYMSVDEFKQYMDSTDGNYVGIGFLSDTRNERIEITRVYSKSPAEKAGLQADDEVIKVDDLTLEADGYKALLEKLRGKEGEIANVTILRNGDELFFKIPRGKVKIPFVDSEIIEDIGYIYISQFGTDAADEFEEHLEALLDKDIKGLILDLRNNPGGLVSECIDISDQLLGKGLVVYTIDNNGDKNTYNSKKSHTDIPMVFLANENSASASEILLAAVKDLERGKIVGKNTFGKGIVQSVAEYSDGSGFKITYSQYFSPLGVEIHKKGVAPDYEVEYEGRINVEAPNLEEDLQLKKAFDLLNEE